MAASLSKTLNLLRPFLFYPRNQPTIVPFSAFSTAEPTLSQTSPAATATSAEASSHSPEKESGRWSKLLLFLPGAITFGLGTWQILRRQEKVEMLEYRRKRLEEEPLVWNKMQILNAESNSLEFRKILCEGDFDGGKSVYIGPRSRSISGVTENGYYVITPLIPRTVDHGRMKNYHYCYGEKETTNRIEILRETMPKCIDKIESKRLPKNINKSRMPSLSLKRGL